MFEKYAVHNQFRTNLDLFSEQDPHLNALSKLKYQHSPKWWLDLSMDEAGIYILTGGRQVGKSTSCKLLMQHSLEEKKIQPENTFYLPCDEIFEAQQLSQTLRYFINQTTGFFLLVIDEVTFVKQWDRVIKSLADEGRFTQGICLLTGSDTLILKEAAMSFPGRRGNANTTDFHIYPLTFSDYVDLVDPGYEKEAIPKLYDNYLQHGGYLRAINDYYGAGNVSEASFQTYEQWIRGDFLKQGKSEEYLLQVLRALFVTGVSQVSYSGLTQKIGLISKETCIDYCRLLQRMDILIELQAFDQNKKSGFPRKARKLHFFDPFIQRTIYQWLTREGIVGEKELESELVEASVASHCHRFAKTYYFKGQGEVDVIFLSEGKVNAVEVKWSEKIRPADLKMLKQFETSWVVSKVLEPGHIDGVNSQHVGGFLLGLGN
jgi:predicted AAA+ superfamily ATPase